MKEINGFQDFVDDLRIAGFTIGGENGEGVFTLSDYFSDKIHWHTEDDDTDPWEWGYGSWMSIVILPMESSFLRKAVI